MLMYFVQTLVLQNAVLQEGVEIFCKPSQRCLTRWGRDLLCKHGDFYTCTDRYNPGVLQKHKWENAMTIDR